MAGEACKSHHEAVCFSFSSLRVIASCCEVPPLQQRGIIIVTARVENIYNSAMIVKTLFEAAVRRCRKKPKHILYVMPAICKREAIGIIGMVSLVNEHTYLLTGNL
jgi:hypothetical protein